MCCICFNRFSKEGLVVLESGETPIYEDVCRGCRQREEQRRDQ